MTSCSRASGTKQKVTFLVAHFGRDGSGSGAALHDARQPAVQGAAVPRPFADQLRSSRTATTAERMKGRTTSPAATTMQLVSTTA